VHLAVQIRRIVQVRVDGTQAVRDVARVEVGNVLVDENAAFPVSVTTSAKSPRRNPLPSTFVSATSWYAACGTAASASFWSVSDSSPRLCTGFVTKTLPTREEPRKASGAALAAGVSARTSARTQTTAAGFISTPPRVTTARCLAHSGRGRPGGVRI
jgi:hypothetical protein